MTTVEGATKAASDTAIMQSKLLGDVMTKGRQRLLDPIQNSFNIVKATHTSDVKKTDLQVALNYLESTVLDNIQMNTKGDFAGLVKDYSMSNNAGYDVGSIVNPTDLSQAFIYNYDVTDGALLSKPNCDYQNATSTNTDYSINLKVTAPLASQSFNGGSSFSIGEILPGYTLTAKIISKDTVTDSHKCSMAFQFGVQDTINDPTGQNIL
jgi:hypothetical protein